MRKPSTLSLLLAVIFVLYPLLVYFGLQQFGPRLLAGLLMLLLIVRILVSRRFGNASGGQWLAVYGASALALVGALVADSSLSLKLYPVLVNVAMLAVFAFSLVYPPSIIERFARLQDPQLPESGVRYTRKVTLIWCVFFVVNGSISLVTIYISDEVWALYNGLISYICIGALFAGEWLYRKWILKIPRT